MIAACVALQWSAAAGAAGDPTPAQMRGARRQVDAVLDPSRLPGRATPATRQQFGELLAYQYLLAAAGRARVLAGGDPTQLRRLRDAAAPVARQLLGADPATLRLTDQGFTPADDAPAVASGAPQAAAGGAPPAPAAGPSGPIAAVVLQFIATGGETFSTTFAPRILYRDGRAIDPPPRGPDDRGRWSGGGRSVTVRWESGRVSHYDNIGTGSYFYARPGAPGQRLAGTFRTLSSSTVVGTTAFSARAITFRPDGTFTVESSGGGFGPNAAAVAKRAGAGRYRIDGWTIAMTDADGHTSSGLFYRYPDSDDVIGIGTASSVRTYIRDKK